MIWTTSALLGGLLAAALIQQRLGGHTAPALAGSRPVVHVGADEHWRPAETFAAAPVAAVAGHTGPDLAEQLILADFDALIESWRVDPLWLTEWRAVVDGAYAAAGLDPTAHHRWRGGALDITTAEYLLVPTPEGGLQ